MNFAATDGWLVLALGTSVVLAQPLPWVGANASVEGLVVSRSTGQPLGRVEVILERVSERESFRALTQHDGQFRFTGLPPGPYRLSVSKPGYLAPTYAELAGTRMPLTFPLSSGENLTDLIVRLAKGAVVAGTVRFRDGEPAVNVPVHLFREIIEPSTRGYTLVSRAQTDDLGRFRFYGLAPGEYYLLAARPALPATQSDRAPMVQEATVPTFYASSPDAAHATALVLREEDELDRLEVVLAEVPVNRVRGWVVRGDTGERVRAASFQVLQEGPRANAWVPVPLTVRWEREGEFELVNVPAGRYLLVAELRLGDTRWIARKRLEVAGGEVRDWEVRLEPEREIMGRLAAAEGAQELENASVLLVPRTLLDAPRPAEVQPDGTFLIRCEPGEIYDVYLEGLPPDAYLESAWLAGTNVLLSGLVCESAGPATLEVVYGTRGARIRGVVTQGPTRVAIGAKVSLIPDPPAGRVQQYRTTRSNPFGLYELRGIAPGRYIAVAWWDDPPCRIYESTELERCRQLGRVVELSPGEEQFLALPVITGR